MFILKKPQISLFFLASFFAALWMATKNYSEFSSYEITLFCLYIGGVFLLQLLCVIALTLCEKFSFIFSPAAKLLATLFTTFNIYTLIIVHNGRFSSMGDLLFILFILAMTLAISLLFFIKNKQFQKFAHVFPLVMTLMVGGQFLSERFIHLGSVFQNIPKHFRYVEFEKKPNIYVISFDAMVPEAIAKNIIGVSDVPYIKEIGVQGEL